MSNPIPLKRRKQLAEAYFFSNYSQKEISAMLETPENTISKWVTAGGWKTIRDAKSITRDKMVGNLLSQVNEIEQTARAEKRNLNAKEADSILKIAAAIEKLDKKINLSVIIQVFKQFNEHLIKEDFELAKQFLQHQNNFIRNHAE